MVTTVCVETSVESTTEEIVDVTTVVWKIGKELVDVDVLYGC